MTDKEDAWYNGWLPLILFVIGLMITITHEILNSGGC